jgi:hypothetical protein
MKSKRIIPLNGLGFAIIVLVFSIGSQQALAANLCGSGLGCGSYNGYDFHSRFFHPFFNPFFHPFLQRLFPYSGCYDGCSGYQLPFP